MVVGIPVTPQSDAPSASTSAPTNLPPYSTRRDTALKDGIRDRLPSEITPQVQDIAGVPVDIGQIKAGFDALFDTLHDLHGVTKTPTVESDLVVQLSEQTFAKHFAVQQELDAALNTVDRSDFDITPQQLARHGIDNPQAILDEILSPDFLHGLAEHDADPNADPTVTERLDAILEQVVTAKVDPKPNAVPARIAAMVDTQRAEVIENTRANPARAINGHVLLNTGHLDGMAVDPARKGDAIRHLLTHEFMHVNSVGSEQTFAHRAGQGGVFSEDINPDEAMTELLAREITDVLAERGDQDVQYIQYPNGTNRYQGNVDGLNNALDQPRAQGEVSAQGTFKAMLDDYFGVDERGGTSGTRPAPSTADAPATVDTTPPPVRDKDVIADESWRHDTASTADWFAPQNPQPSALWDSVRDKAPVRTVDTEVADVQRSSTSNNVDSLTGIIRHDVRRMEVAPGSWVKEYTLKVHLKADGDLPPPGLDGVRQKTVEGVDRLLNQGYRLPSGDQFHARVEFVTDPAQAHTTVDVSTAATADQLNWGTNTSSNVLAHEVAHYFGLPDEYKDAAGPDARIFNSDGKPLPEGHTQSNLVVNDNGLMGAGVHTDPSIKPRHLWLIERTTNSQVMVPDADHATLHNPDSPPQTPPPRPPEFGTQPDPDTRPDTQPDPRPNTRPVDTPPPPPPPPP
ncbi:hypothetical protein ADK67_08100, partial [Saccharothrix sp. NRRL B-16348]